LKILIIYPNWDDPRIKAYYTEKDFEWNYIFNDFKEETMLIGYFAVIVINWKEKLKIYSFVYGDTGEIVEEENVLFEY